MSKREKGVCIDRGYVLIRFWPWGRANKPYTEYFGPENDTNLTIANNKMREYRSAVDLNKFDIEPNAEPIRFDKAAQAIIVKHKPSMKYHLRSSIDYFGQFWLHDITPALVRLWREKRAKDGLKFSGINREQACLSVVFTKHKDWNIENGALGEKVKLPKDNPCESVTKPTEVHEARKRILSPEEWGRLKPNLDEAMLDHCTMGLISSLSLKDVCELAGKKITADVMEGIRSKTGVAYELPLTESLRAVALRIAARPFLSQGVVQDRFREACIASGIRDCTFRDLRRTGLKWLDKLGTRRTVVRDRAAHTNSKTTDLYIGSDTGEQLDALKLLEGVFK